MNRQTTTVTNTINSYQDAWNSVKTLLTSVNTFHQNSSSHESEIICNTLEAVLSEMTVYETVLTERPYNPLSPSYSGTGTVSGVRVYTTGNSTPTGKYPNTGQNNF